MKDEADLDYFDEFDETDMVSSPCYALAVYDLSQMKLKTQKVYEKAVAKLVPDVANPTDDEIVKALFLEYWNKPTGSTTRKFEKLYRDGLINV